VTNYELKGISSLSAVQDFSLLHNVKTDYGYRELFLCQKRGKNVKLTVYLHMVPRSRKLELYLHYPMSSWHSAQLSKFRNRFSFFKKRTKAWKREESKGG
jgi:hypothetical protein